MSNQATKELEGEIGSIRQTPNNQQVATARARASDLPVLVVSGVDSPRSRIGRGLESIGGMTAETLQRISTAVGGVVKTPVVLMAKVGGLASPRAVTPTAPPGSSLEERVHHLEIQMKNLEEKFSSMTVVTELDLSMRSHKEKPRIAKSLLQEMETDRMLEKRVQMLEDHINERMEKFEKVLSNIQSRLDHVEFSKRENVVVLQRQESLSGEPQYYDAEQQSDNFGALEAVEQKFLGALGEATGSSPTLEKSRVKETLFAAPTTVEHVEPLQENDIGKNDDFLEPQVVSTPVYSKEAFLTQPMKSSAPSSEPPESVPKDDAGNLPSPSDRQLASTLEELHGSFVTESSTAAASAKFLEIARAVTAEKSTLAHASSKPQFGSALEEPREAFLGEPFGGVPVAKFEEHAQEDATNKSGTTIAAAESPLPPTFEAIQKDFIKEPLTVAPNAKLSQELAAQGVVIIALASSQPTGTSKSMEEPLVAIPSANFEELVQKDNGDKSVIMTVAGELPKAFAFQDPQKDFVKESLAHAPEYEPSSQEGSGTTSDIAPTSSESLVASKSIEEPSTAALGTNFEEHAQEDAAGKSGNTIAVAKLPLASSLEEPQEESVKEFMAVALSTKSTEVLATQEDNDMQVATPESQMTSKFTREPLAATPSADSEEPAQDDVVHKTGTTMATVESSLASSLEEPKEGFEKESMTFAPSGKTAQDYSDMAVASSETEGASKFVEEASAVAPSANFGEREHKVDVDESGTIIAGAESPLASSFDDPQEDLKESSTVASNAEPAQELAIQEDRSMALAPPETRVKSKFAEDPSTAVASTGFEELARENVDKDISMTVPTESPLLTSHQGPQEDFEKESLASAPSVEPIHEPSSQEDSGATSDKALASFEPQVASKFVEEPSPGIPNANFEEPARKDEVDKSVTMIAAADSPLPTSHQSPHEDFEKEFLAGAPSAGPIHEPSSLEDSSATSDMALASSDPPRRSKFVEEPSLDLPSSNFEEPAQEDGVVKSDTMIAGVKSPLTSSFEEPHEDFEKESMAVVSGTEPTQELATQEQSEMAPISCEPKLASKFVEEPSAAVSSVGFGEPAYEDAADKSVTMIATREDPQEDFVEESLAASMNAGSIHEPSSQEDLGATSNKALASSKSQVASKFVEEPSSAVPSANFEEHAQDEDVVKNDTMSVGADSLFASAFEEAQEDFEKESLTVTLSHEPTRGLAMENDSHMAPTSSESQEVSKYMEGPLAIEPSADFEEPTHEDAVDKNVAMIAAGVSPFTSSFEKPQDDSEKESIVATSSIEPAQELTTQVDSDIAPSEPQVASKFVEKPSTTDLPSAKFEEPTHKDIVDRSGPMTVAVESPLVSSLEAHKKDYTKESLAAGSSAKVLEPLEEDESGKSCIAFAPLEAPSTHFFGIPQEASLKEPLRTSVQLKEPEQEKSGIMLPYADSTLTSTVEENNHAAMESEYKLAEDFKVHHEHIKSIEKEFPKNQSNLAHVSSNESLAAEDSDDRLESDQSGEEFFDAEHDSGSLESWESDDPKSFEEFGIGPNELGEATGINIVAQKETLVPSSSVEPEQAPAREFAQESEQTLVRELEQPPDQAPVRELDQDHESGEQAHAQEHEQQPTQEQEQQLAQEQEQHAYGQQLAQERKQHSEQELERQLAQQHGQQTAQEHGQEHGQVIAQAPGQESEQEPAQELEQQSIQEPAHKLEQQSEQPMQEPEQEDLTRNSAMALPQVTSKSGESQELLTKESLVAVPSTKFEEPPQANATDENGTRDLPLTSPSEETQIDTIASPKKSISSTSFQQSGNPELLEHKSSNTPGISSSPKEALEREPSTTAPITEIAQGYEESPLTSIAEEPQNGSMNSGMEGKHVKIIAEPIEEVIPRTQSDLTHAELNSKAAEDATKLQSQGSFLAFGDTSVDSKEALAKESLPSTKLLELFEEENNFEKKGPALADSPMTSTMEEPQKPLVEERLASAKSVPKSQTRRRGFARSSSEPQFAYKLEEHRKALAKESLVTAVPSASKLSEEHDQEDFGDTQCLPFRILGEGKHPRKESEFKLVEDVRSPAIKSERNPKSSLQSQASNPYVLEPKPSKLKEKKKKEKKERKPDATAEEKERRLSLGSGEIERKSSLRAEEKDSKYLPRAEEKHKQPFRHLRERLRHAFSVNKEP